jgi:alpha,alpha-trehalase
MPLPASYLPVLDHIEGKWDALVRTNPTERGTLIGLPFPYVVPSDGSMFQEMYYWDSFFSSLGLVDTEREDLIVDMADNFAYLLERFGMIPNGSRYYFLSRSQPPFFTQQMMMAWDVKVRRRDPKRKQWLARMVALAEAEHETVWLGTKQPHHRLIHRGLSRYFDINYLDMLASCESGWDHSTRCDDRWLAHLPVDLNCLLALREADLVRAHSILGNDAAAAGWSARRETRVKTIRSLMWNADTSCYLDYDLTNRTTNPTVSAAMFSALWAEVATPAQARKMVAAWFPKFLKKGGIVTSLKARSGRQWAYPNGWAPLQWIAVEGLLSYGFEAEAFEVMRRWCDMTATVYADTGQMWEKLNVVTAKERTEEGFYGAITGFGWSNGAFVDFARRLDAIPGI